METNNTFEAREFRYNTMSVYLDKGNYVKGDYAIVKVDDTPTALLVFARHRSYSISKYYIFKGRTDYNIKWCYGEPTIPLAKRCGDIYGCIVTQAVDTLNTGVCDLEVSEERVSIEWYSSIRNPIMLYWDLSWFERLSDEEVESLKSSEEYICYTDLHYKGDSVYRERTIVNKLADVDYDLPYIHTASSVSPTLCIRGIGITYDEFMIYAANFKQLMYDCGHNRYRYDFMCVQGGDSIHIFCHNVNRYYTYNVRLNRLEYLTSDSFYEMWENYTNWSTVGDTEFSELIAVVEETQKYNIEKFAKNAASYRLNCDGKLEIKNGLFVYKNSYRDLYVYPYISPEEMDSLIQERISELKVENQ